MKSREMLEDAQYALNLMDTEEDVRKIRILWVASITLVRGIGHVLDKVDACQDTALRTKVDDWWRDLQRQKEEHPHIFWDFIDPQRNKTLKEYCLCFDEYCGPICVVDGLTGNADSFDLGSLYIPAHTMPYVGDDIRDLLKEAVEWWAKQLDFLSV